MKKWLVICTWLLVTMTVGCSYEVPEQEKELPKPKQELTAPKESPKKSVERKDQHDDFPKAEVVPQGFDLNDRWIQLIQAGGFKYSHTNRGKFTREARSGKGLFKGQNVNPDKLAKLMYVAHSNPSFLKDGSILLLDGPTGKLAFIIRADGRVPNGELFIFTFDELVLPKERYIQFTRDFKVFESQNKYFDWESTAEIVYGLNVQFSRTYHK